MEPRAFVHICVPSRDHWKAEFGVSLMRAQAYAITQGIIPYCHLRTGSIVADLRNDLVQAAITSKACTHVLFIDDDQMFPADTIERLLDRDCDIVGANIVRKEPNPRTNSREIVPEGFEGKGNCCWTRPDSTGAVEVDFVGTGLIMIKREVFDAMDKPYYFYDVKAGAGEDVMFCLEARKKGFKTYIDHDLSKEVKHVGSFYWGHEHTDIWRLDMERKNGNS